MKPIAIAAGALVGGITGYYAGAYAACFWLWPGNNLCGLFGAFLTGPLGLAIGATVGWLPFRGTKGEH